MASTHTVSNIGNSSLPHLMAHSKQFRAAASSGEYQTSSGLTRLALSILAATKSFPLVGNEWSM